MLKNKSLMNIHKYYVNRPYCFSILNILVCDNIINVITKYKLTINPFTLHLVDIAMFESCPINSLLMHTPKEFPLTGGKCLRAFSFVCVS